MDGMSGSADEHEATPGVAPVSLKGRVDPSGTGRIPARARPKVGALARVGAEAIGGYQAVAGPLVALGGALGVGGFAVFASGMWSALGRLPGSTQQSS